MEHLQINPHCDCKFPITWVAKNVKTCRINRDYKERHEPTLNGVSISVRIPNSEYFAEFAANDAGWMYVSDWSAPGLEEIPIEDGIKEVEANVANWLKDNGY